MVLVGVAGPSFYYLFSLSPLLKSGTTKIYCSSPGWTVSCFCFLGVRADSDLKEGWLQLVFESAFWGPVKSFAVARCKGWSAGVMKEPFRWHVLTPWGNAWWWQLQCSAFLSNWGLYYWYNDPAIWCWGSAVAWLVEIVQAFWTLHRKVLKKREWYMHTHI